MIYINILMHVFTSCRYRNEKVFLLHICNACSVHVSFGIHWCKLFPGVTHHVVALYLVNRFWLSWFRIGTSTHYINIREVVRRAGAEVGTRRVHRGKLLSWPGSCLEIKPKRSKYRVLLLECVQVVLSVRSSDNIYSIRHGKSYLAFNI